MKTFLVNTGYLDMWPKTILALALIVALGTLAPKSSRANADDWRNLDSREHIILFSPPFIGDWNPGITVQVEENKGARQEWLCWRHFETLAANACITYAKQGRRFSHSTARNVLEYYTDFENIEYTITRQSKKLDHELSTFDTVLFTYTIFGKKKYCVAFSTLFNGRRQAIEGWYCAPINKPLSESIVQKMISTIGLKGKHEPAKVRYVPVLDLGATNAPVVVTRSDDQITIRGAGSSQDVYDTAKTHCESLGKTSYLMSNAESTGVYTFSCATSSSEATSATSQQMATVLLSSFDGVWILEIVDRGDRSERDRVETEIIDGEFSAEFLVSGWRGTITGEIDEAGKLVGRGDAKQMFGVMVFEFYAQYGDGLFHAVAKPRAGDVRNTFEITLAQESPTTTVPENSVTSDESIEDRLRELKSLQAEGLISEEEATVKRQQILDDL